MLFTSIATEAATFNPLSWATSGRIVRDWGGRRRAARLVLVRLPRGVVGAIGPRKHEVPTMRRVPVTIAAILLLAAATVAPVSAKPVVSQGSWFQIWPDTDNGLVVFFNITRDAYCAWEASDFEGEAPITTTLTIRENGTPTGAVVFSATGTSSLELWSLDADADLSGPCQDTDDSTEPWAAGTARYGYHDNDIDHDASVEDYGLRRSDAFGESAGGHVVDAGGMSWRYSWTVHNVYDKNLEFRPVVEFRGVLSRGG